MHIKDGILSPEVCIATGLIAVGAVAFSLHKLRNSLSDRTVPLTGMMASLVFAGQMVNFPLVGTPVSGHLLGGVLAACVVGPWAGCVAISLVLFVQMALFSDGGWTVLGANIVNMGVVGAWGGYAVFASLRKGMGTGFTGTVVAAVLAAWLSVLAGAALFCLEFRCSWPGQTYDFTRIYALMTLLHSAIGLGEAAITGLVISFVFVQRPDLIYRPEANGGAVRAVLGTMSAGVVAALAVAAFLAPFASEHADGLDTVAARTNFSELEKPPTPLALDDYKIPLPGGRWEHVAVSLAGIVGTGAVLGLAALLGLVYRPARPPLPNSSGAP